VARNKRFIASHRSDLHNFTLVVQISRNSAPLLKIGTSIHHSFGRFEQDTSGLIIMTSYSRVPNSVLRGAQKHPKTYMVKVHKPLTPAPKMGCNPCATAWSLQRKRSAARGQATTPTDSTHTTLPSSQSFSRPFGNHHCQRLKSPGAKDVGCGRIRSNSPSPDTLHGQDFGRFRETWAVETTFRQGTARY
jgi:hypothetical protein